MHNFAICPVNTSRDEIEHAWTLALKIDIAIGGAERAEKRGRWDLVDRWDAILSNANHELHELGWVQVLDDDEHIVGISKKTVGYPVYVDITALTLERHPNWTWLND